MDKDRIYFASQAIELSESKSYIELKTRLCYYGEPNLNDVILPIEGAEEKAESLVNMPVVAKYVVNKLGQPDFKGHEAYFDPVSGEVKFGTESVGTHIAVEIKSDRVVIDGVEKVLPCLFATSRVWKRHKNTVEAIKRLYSEGKLYTSWEISVFSYEYADGIKTLTDYLFEGNCLLGEGILPAYGKTSVVLDVASRKESEKLIAEALAKDVSAGDFKEEKMENNNANKVDEEIISENQNTENTEVTEEVSNGESSESADMETNAPEDSENLEEETKEEEKEEPILNEESSEKTSSNEDYEKKFAEATEEIEKLKNALTESASKIAEMKDTILELTKYKDFYDAEQAEKEKKERAEKSEALAAKALRSKMISKEELETDEGIKKMISEIDEAGINNLIASRYMEMLEKEEPEIAAIKKTPRRNFEEEELDGKNIFRAYLND